MASVSDVQFELWEDMDHPELLIKAAHRHRSFDHLSFSSQIDMVGQGGIVGGTQPSDGSILVESVSRGLSRRLEVSSVTPVKKLETKRRKVGLRSISKVLSYDKEPEVESAAKKFDSAIRQQLSAWTDKLIELQPKVYMNAHICESGLCLFKVLRQRQLQAWIDGRLEQSYINNKELLRCDLVAAWWIAMKHCSVRTAVPNRALLARATDSKKTLLSECELSALCTLEWDIQKILVAHGLVIDTE